VAPKKRKTKLKRRTETKQLTGNLTFNEIKKNEFQKQRKKSRI
jgi:hypothetical protein